MDCEQDLYAQHDYDEAVFHYPNQIDVSSGHLLMPPSHAAFA